MEWGKSELGKQEKRKRGFGIRGAQMLKIAQRFNAGMM